MLTFTLGLKSVYFYDNLQNPLIQQTPSNKIVTDVSERQRFTRVSVAVGVFGRSEDYISDDGQRLTFDVETNECITTDRKDKRIILSDSERIILKIKIRQEIRFKIYLLKSAKCIDVPNIDLGLEFIEWHRL